MNIHKFLNILALIVLIFIGYIVVVGILWYNCPNSWLTQSLVFSNFKYIYEYSPGFEFEAERVGKELEFNHLHIDLREYSPNRELLTIRSTRSRMMLNGTPYDFSQINPEVVKGFGAQKEIGSNSINDSEWTRESTNPMTHMSWIFNNSTLYFFYYDMQHLPDSAKGTRSAPIQFSIEGSEWIQLPIKEQDLVRILGKPKKISREPLFP